MLLGCWFEHEQATTNVRDDLVAKHVQHVRLKFSAASLCPRSLEILVDTHPRFDQRRISLARKNLVHIQFSSTPALTGIFDAWPVFVCQV